MRLCALVWWVLGTAGCGDSQPTQPLLDCPQPFSPCGGNLVGTWNHVQVCNIFGPSCVGVDSVRSTTREVFAADGTFTINAGSDETAGAFPSSCFAPNGPLAAVGCNMKNETCGLDETGRCLCSGSNGYGSTFAHYVVDQTTLTIHYDLDMGASTRTFSYCIKDSHMFTKRTDVATTDYGIYQLDGN